MTQKYVEFDILENGNLHIALVPEQRDEVVEILHNEQLDADGCRTEYCVKIPCPRGLIEEIIQA